MSNVTLGQKIRDIRISKGLTQSDLGSGLVTPSMISQIESDKARPSYAVLEAIAKKLDTPLEHFLADVQTQLLATTLHKAGRAILSSGKYDKALEILQSAFDSQSNILNYTDLHRDLGECYLALEQYEASAKHLKEALRTADESGESYTALHVLNKLGEMERRRQRYHSAVHYWRTAQERFGELSEPEPFIQSQILMNLGTTHQELGEFSEARSYFEQAYELLAGTEDVVKIANAYLSLGLSYLDMKAYEHASEYLQYATAIFESTNNIKAAIQSKRRYGFVLGEEGRYEEAIQMLLECMDEFSDHQYPLEVAGVHNEVAQLYLRQGKFGEARTECVDAINMTPKESVEAAYLMRTLAQSEAGLGNLDAGIEAAEKALAVFREQQLLAEVSETYSLLGGLYEKVGNFVKATEYLQRMKQSLNENLKTRGIIL